MNAKIKEIGIFVAEKKLEKPINDSIHKLTSIKFIVLRLVFEDGIVGESFILSFQFNSNGIIGALEDVCSHVIDRSLSEYRSVEEAIYNHNEYFGREGLNQNALAAFSVAIWDAKCKKIGLPIWRLLGNYQEKVPIYGSGGWLSYTEDELIDEVLEYKKRGFDTVKMKVGNKDWKKDYDRIKLVRSKIGSKMTLNIDGNQGMSLDSCIKLMDACQDLDIGIFEEPLSHIDYDGFEKLKLSSKVAISMGEREYNSRALSELAGRRSLDYWQPDIIRIGGVEGWLESSALAKYYGIPVLPHFYKEYDIPLLSTIKNGSKAEYFNWVDELLESPVEVQKGFARLSEKPGWGFSFKDSVLKEILIVK